MAVYRYYILDPTGDEEVFAVKGWARTEESAIGRVHQRGKVVYASNRQMAVRRAADGTGRGQLVWAHGIGRIRPENRITG